MSYDRKPLTLRQIDRGDLERTSWRGVAHLVPWAVLDGWRFGGALCGVSPAQFGASRHDREPLPLCEACAVRQRIAARWAQAKAGAR